MILLALDLRATWKITLGSATYYSSPQGTPAASFAIISNTNPTLLTMDIQGGDDLYMNYLQANGNGTSTFGVEVTDTNGQKDTAYFITTIDPRADILFQAKWLMSGNLATNSTLHIGSSQYTMSNGTITLQVEPGTQELNVTNPNSIDNTLFWETYTAIQRPGQVANVEQRAGGDNTSQVTIGTVDDTLIFKKIKNDFNMYSVAQATGTGPNGETIRFSYDDWDATAYFDESGTNQTPNATTISRVQDLINNHIPPATDGKLEMVYGQGSNPPTSENYLEMAINIAFPGPGNGTTWDSNFEITFAYAHWATNTSTQALWAEIIQAVQHQTDVGISVTYYNGSSWEISDFGKECLKFGYNFDPGTKFLSTSDAINNSNFIKDFHGPKYHFEKGNFSHPEIEAFYDYTE